MINREHTDWPDDSSHVKSFEADGVEVIRGTAFIEARGRVRHVPLSGPGGTLEALAGLERPRKALVHINNTNPILLEDLARAGRRTLRAGVEVAYDGLEIEL